VATFVAICQYCQQQGRMPMWFQLRTTSSTVWDAAQPGWVMPRDPGAGRPLLARKALPADRGLRVLASLAQLALLASRAIQGVPGSAWRRWQRWQPRHGLGFVGKQARPLLKLRARIPVPLISTLSRARCISLVLGPAGVSYR